MSHRHAPVSALQTPRPLQTTVRSKVVLGQRARHLSPQVPGWQLRTVRRHDVAPKSWQADPQTKDVVSFHSAVHSLQTPFQHVPRPLQGLPAIAGQDTLQ